MGMLDVGFMIHNIDNMNDNSNNKPTILENFTILSIERISTSLCLFIYLITFIINGDANKVDNA